MLADIKSLSKFKITFALYFIVIYGLFTCVRDFFYAEEIFSCTRGYNLCENLPAAKLLTNIYLIRVLFFIKGLFYLGLLKTPLRRFSLVGHILILAYFFFVNRVFYTPEMAYIHFLFFCLLFSPQEQNSFFPRYIFKPFEVVVYLSYVFSGYFKLNSIYWMDGSFLNRFLSSNQVVLPWLDGISLNFSLLYYPSFFVLFLELFAFMALLSKYFKVFFWTGLTLMHVSIFFITDLTEVSFGMFAVHLFLIDEHIFDFYHLLKNNLAALINRIKFYEN
jgi:hypothetical protein